MVWRFFAAILLLGVPALARAEDWPGWRGPRGDGSSLEINVPVTWSKTDNVAWKTFLPGIGHSSPTVSGDRVFVTSCLFSNQRRQPGKDRVLFCLDRRSGSILWHRVVVTAPLEKKHKLNSFASATPATDGKYVWVTFFDHPNLVVACYDYAGNKIWQKTPGEFHSAHGFCSSPILYKDTIIINGDQDALAYIVALDKRTGTERWRTDRPNRIRSYCAPLIVDAAGKKQLVLSGCKCVASYDPDTGKQHWIIDGPTEQFVASLVYTDDVFFLTAGFPDYHNMGIRPDGSGNVTKTHILWHEKRTPARNASYVPSPIALGHYFYVISDLGYLSCFEAKTGKRQYMELLGNHHSASPVSSNGFLYLPSDEGVTYVVKAGPKFELVASNDLGNDIYASPAISQGQIFLRTLGYLYCIGAAKRG
jgi:outer membrane protein assembly factor BamB